MRKRRGNNPIRIGPGHAVMPWAVHAILGADIARSEQLMSQAGGQGLLIDTCGAQREVRSLIILETGYLLNSSVLSETLIARVAKSVGKGDFPDPETED